MLPLQSPSSASSSSAPPRWRSQAGAEPGPARRGHSPAATASLSPGDAGRPFPAPRGEAAAAAPGERSGERRRQTRPLRRQPPPGEKHGTGGLRPVQLPWRRAGGGRRQTCLPAPGRVREGAWCLPAAAERFQPGALRGRAASPRPGAGRRCLSFAELRWGPVPGPARPLASPATERGVEISHPGGAARRSFSCSPAAGQALAPACGTRPAHRHLCRGHSSSEISDIK